MTYYDEFENKYYNPDDDEKKPGMNENWKSIQKGFSKISTTQIETSEGLTLGKGTEDEESLSAEELSELKNPSQLETSGGLTLGKGTENEESLTASELKEIKASGVVFVIAKGSGEVGRTTRALTKGDANEISHVLKINNLTPNKKYAFINAISDNSGTDFRFIETAPLYPSNNYVYEANDSGEISITFVFHVIALTSLSQYTVIEGQYYVTLLEINDSVDSTITIN